MDKSSGKLSEHFQLLFPKPGGLRVTISPSEKLSFARKLEDEGPPLVYEKFELIPGSGLFSNGRLDKSRHNFFSSMGIGPDELVGKRVLDIGSFSGAHSFEAEDFGATVVSIDIMEPHSNGYALHHEIRNSSATHVMCSVYDLDPDFFGTFDYVVFSGVHYHLRHPLLALERINAVMETGCTLLVLGTTADFWVPTVQDNGDGVNLADEIAPVIPNFAGLPVGLFYSGSFYGDRSNWFIPTLQMLNEWILSCGFEIESSTLSRSEILPGQSRSSVPQARGGARVRARKVANPSPEYENDVYSNSRQVDVQGKLNTYPPESPRL